MTRFVDPFPQYITTSEGPLIGGSVEIRNSNTDELVALFSVEGSDPDTKITNPVLLGDDGQVPDIYFGGGILITVTVSDSEGNLVRTSENIPTGISGVGSQVFNFEITYSKGERTLFNGLWYESNEDDNKGNSPSISPVFWTQEVFTGIYNINVSYNKGDIAIEAVTGIVFVSKVDANLNNPLTDIQFWGNASGIGLHTVNILGATTNNDDAIETINAAKIGAFIVPTRDFIGITGDSSVQFSFPMPEAWDGGQLTAFYGLVSRVTVTAGTDAVFNIAGTAFGNGTDISAGTFGSGVDVTISGITTANTRYLSDKVDFNVSDVTASKNLVVFRLTRKIASPNTITSPLGLINVILLYKTVSSTDNA